MKYHENQDMLITLFERFEDVELAFRERRSAAWKLLDNYWHGIQKDYYENLERPDTKEVSEEEVEKYLANRILNVYRAHGESIISALSNTFPVVSFYPEDADKSNDVSAALTRSKLGRLIVKQNKPEIFLARVFYIMYNQDFVACHLSTEDGKGFSYEQKSKKLKECPECKVKTENGVCPECGDMQEEISEKRVPKKYQLLKAFGPRNVQIPSQTRSIKELPYVILREIQPTTWLRNRYKEYKDHVQEYDYGSTNNQILLSYKEYDENTEDSSVVITFWIRPWAFNALEDSFEDEVKAFLKKYPKGARVTICGKTVVECVPEDLTDVWVFTESPLNETVYDDPIGKILVDNQDLMNETFNLIIKTISQGVPETYADPETVDTDAISKRDSEPGQVVPAKAPSKTGRLGDAFHQNQPASLSENVVAFLDRLQQQAQFLTGSYPSIYGGNIKGSRTVGEYQMSGERALERLSIRYTIAKEFIVEIITKAVERYMSHMSDREVLVMKVGENFISDAIRKQDLMGDVGRVEVEGGGHVPLSWTQIKNSLFELLNSNNQMLATIMSHPQNSTMVKEVIGIPDLYVPGEDSRNKQWYEISLMMEQEPPNEGESSVPVIPEVDNHGVELEICKIWLSSDKGLFIKQTKANQYANVQAHATSPCRGFSTATTATARATTTRGRPKC